MKSTFARRVGRVCCQALASISVLLCAVVAAAQTPKRVALLVGVGDYRQTSKLEGPANDVTALRDVLLRRWGFQAQDIRTLVDKQATRVNILAELVALANRSSANDEVLVYFSGHGTSALDAGTQSAFSIPLPHSSGAFVPFDFEPQAGASRFIASASRALATRSAIALSTKIASQYGAYVAMWRTSSSVPPSFSIAFSLFE